MHLHISVQHCLQLSYGQIILICKMFTNFIILRYGILSEKSITTFLNYFFCTYEIFSIDFFITKII